MADMGDEPHEVLKAQTHVWNHLFNFINSMSLKCAVQLGIPDIVRSHGCPMTLSQLVAMLSISPTRAAHVGRLMRLLVHSGFFAVQEINDDQGGDKEGYVLTPSSRLLLKDTATCISPFFMMVLDPVLVTPWHFLNTWFLGDDPTPFHVVHGTGVWDHMAQNPDLNNFFNEAMACDARLVMSIIIKECSPVFQGLRSLVDVGGGTGTAAGTIAESFPHVKCTVFDLPHVVASVPKGQNIDIVGGNMFESIPSADAVFLKMDDPVHLEKFNHNLSAELPLNATELKDMRPQHVDYFLVLDLEGKVEILEFPVVMIDAKTMDFVDSFHRFVRPGEMSEQRIKEYIEGKYGKLGVDRVWHDTAIPFKEMLQEFEIWITHHRLWKEELGGSLHRAAFVTCGNWDLKTKVPQQCRVARVKMPPYFMEWINLKDVYLNFYQRRATGMMTMMKELGIPLVGSHHLGIDDAKNISRVLLRMLADGAVLQITARRNPTAPGNVEFLFKNRIR